MPKVLDRDLLIFFRTLCKTCNLAAAANSLGIPAATASRMLGKLREAFGDELFTRTATGLVPNWRAQRAVPHVQTLLEEYELLLEDKVFTPAEIPAPSASPARITVLTSWRPALRSLRRSRPWLRWKCGT